MGSAAQFVAQFFPIFLLGAVFGKLMEDSGSVSAIADFMTEKLGPRRAVLAVVLAGAFVTYGGVSLFVAFFVLAPMAHALFQAAAIPKTPDARGARARHLDLHYVGAARNAGNPKRDPDAVFRHHAVRGAGPRRDRVGDHARLRTVVAPPRRGRRPPRRRGLWRGRRRQHRCGTKRGSRRADSRARHGSPGIRSRRDRARTRRSINSADRARRVAADRGGGRQSDNVDIRAAASRCFLSGRGALGPHIAPRRGRGVVGRGRACCRDRDARCRQLSAPAHLARKPGRRRKRFRLRVPSALQAWSASVQWLRHCRPSPSCANGSCRSRAAPSSRLQYQQHARRPDRFRFGRTDDRARCAWRYLYAPCRGKRHRPRDHAPRRGHRRRNARQPAAQRRGRDAARRVRSTTAKAISISSWSRSSALSSRWPR